MMQSMDEQPTDPRENTRGGGLITGLEGNTTTKTSDGHEDVIVETELGSSTLGSILRNANPDMDLGELSKFDEEDDPIYIARKERELEASIGFFIPDSEGRTYWEMTMVVFTLYCAYTIPFYMAWKITASGGSLVIEYFIDFFFVLDLFFTFRTGFYDVELRENCYDQKKIAIRYLRSWFLVDFLSAAPLSLLQGVDDSAAGGAGAELRAISLVRLVRTWSRIIRMTKVIKMNKFITQVRPRHPATKHPY